MNPIGRTAAKKITTTTISAWFLSQHSAEQTFTLAPVYILSYRLGSYASLRVMLYFYSLQEAAV